ncbi:DUF6588 family protein [Winogradskyella arenosi]|uniref:Uncharacterized protein n=1 Tax=Winogradskyella arenosi TaxID=533325 RepID=A0A368ZD01_9FLAO|nr:DUF6588 family protein [Winogradskyella arenosi]RCW90043.1 hypothetical protein DFQ08_106150 [Winogradskyella arenosi]
MKRLILFTLLGFLANDLKAQNDIDVFLAAGIDDAQRFANDYLAPGTNGIMHSMNANWFNSAEVKPLGGFEVSVVVNAALINDEHKTFSLDTDTYNNVQFVAGPNAQLVSSVLGKNEPPIFVEVTYEDPIFGTQTTEVELPEGIGENSANMLPTAFIQGAVGLGKGVELKARFVPKVDTDDVSLSMYGAGLQLEVTDWLPTSQLWPVALSGLVAYNHVDASYNLMESSGIDGENQRLENDTNTWLFQVIASTKLPVINVYGGVGLINGTSESDLLGSYRVTNGLLSSETIVDPFSVSSNVSSVRGTIGAKLKVGFFRLNAEYHMSEYDAFSVGINFGFR